MKKALAIILLAVNITGCQSALHATASFYNYRDQCQSYGKSSTWSMPDYCGAGVYSRNRAVITDSQGRTTGYVR